MEEIQNKKPTKSKIVSEKQSVCEVPKNENLMGEPRKKIKTNPIEKRRSQYKERAISLKTKVTSDEEILSEWLFKLQGSE